MKSVFDTARDLALAHRQDDPATTEIYLAEAPDEVRLVEVSGSVGASPSGRVLPFRFLPQPHRGIDYPSAIVLLSPGEWTAVQRGELQLPPGWNKDLLKKVG